MIDKVTPYDDSTETVLAGIQTYFPAAKIVRLIRDGRDVATSGAFDWLTKDAQGTDRHAFYVEGSRTQPLDRFFDDVLIRRWASSWVEVNEGLVRSGRVAIWGREKH